jgi:RNA polymerase sigma-70 factor (ECF subfamily)
MFDDLSTIFESLSKENHMMIRNFIKKQDHYGNLNQSDIDDIYNAVMLKCFEKISSYNGNCKFSTWICGYCRNISLNYLAKKLRSRRRLVPFEDIYVYNINPLEIIIKKELYESLYISFSFLKKEDREIIRWRIFDGKSYSNISSLTGENPSKVRKKYLNSIKKITIIYKSIYSDML